MYKINKQLWLGNYKDLKNYKTLKKAKITAILNVAYDIPNPIYPDIKSLKIGLIDDSIEQDDMIRIAIGVLEALIEMGEKVIVTCACGISRSPYIVAKYLEEAWSMDLDTIYKKLKTLKPIIDENTPLRKEYYTPSFNTEK